MSAARTSTATKYRAVFSVKVYEPWIINDADGNPLFYGASTTQTVTATVADAALTMTGLFAPLGLSEGTSVSNVQVAHFTDANPFDLAGTFTATISWGDGFTSLGTVAAGSGGGFDVRGSHTFSDAIFAGTFTVLVSDHGGGATASQSMSISVADLPLIMGSITAPIGATEGTATPVAPVAHFTDGNPLADASDFTATISWGDGTTSLGTVGAASGGGFDVTASHAYVTAFSDGVLTVLVSDIGGQTTSGSVSGVTVADVPLTMGSITPLAATEGLTSSGVMAHFTDGNTLAVPGDFAATITWADGTTSLGTVSGSGGSFDVSVSHMYTDITTGAVTVSISDRGGETTAGSQSSVTVADAALTNQQHGPGGYRRHHHQWRRGALHRRQRLRRGSDSLRRRSLGLTARPPPATVVGSNGSFDVLGTHAYTDETTGSLTVFVSDVEGAAGDTGGGRDGGRCPLDARECRAAPGFRRSDRQRRRGALCRCKSVRDRPRIYGHHYLGRR